MAQKIVSIGGGTGHFTWLRGVVKCNEPQLNTAIVATWDSGRSSGQLRIQEGILPPGDYMQCLLALMENDGQLEEAFRILRDRSDVTHPLVNQFAAKAEKTHHGVEGGIEGLKKLFRVRGNIIPVSLIDTDLNAETKKGTSFAHEHEIDDMKNDPIYLNDEILRIFLSPLPDANPKALQAIKEADKIVVAPGSPYTSIFPHLLVKNIPKAILNSSSKLVVVLNLMTTKGEDHHLTTASSWLKVFQYYLGDKEWIKKTGKSRINYLVVNENHIEKEVLNIYLHQGQKPVEIDGDKCQKLAPGIKIVATNLVSYDRYSHLLRHDPVKLAKTILAL
ncbi:MAG: 2-phospho-L-lactate transferase CofD family protein [Candidatus Daviesbacteria bacterium]